MNRKSFLFWCFFGALLFAMIGCKRLGNQPYQIVKHVIADSAMVTTAHPLATAAGIRILQQGGNAIDATVAVFFTLSVVYPAAGNIGGGGFLILYTPDGEAASLDFRERAPIRAHRDMYLDDLGEVIPDASTLGHLAVGVPGSVDGMVQAHKRYGKLPWPLLLEEAIHLARDGFVITEMEAQLLEERRDIFRAFNPENMPLIKPERWKLGDRLVQHDLAKSLERIRDHGREGFYAGETAALIVQEMSRGSGLIQEKDLSDYQSIWRSPLVGRYQDFQVITMPPPSSGGIALLQLLGMMATTEWNSQDFHQPATMHFMAEASRRVYADRALYLGDPDWVEVPVMALLDSNYLAQRIADVKKDTVTSSVNIHGGLDIPTESEETTHFSIVDKDGFAVSVTTTLNLAYGSKVMVQGAGFLLNNEMDDFSAKPGVPNQFGLIGGLANAIDPGKRMLSSMTPTIMVKNKKPILVVGSPGGSTIITSVFQVILGVTDFERNLEEVIQSPRFHHQWRPDTLFVEPGFDTSTLKRLKLMGHTIIEREPYGRVDGIWIAPNGRIHGVADKRGDDHAAGY